MKIGLIRHFKVERGYPNKLVTKDELLKWIDEYDASDVIENDIDLCNIEWQKCYSSDLKRAELTAKKAFTGNVIFLPELREIKLSPFFKRNIRLPLFLHLLFSRIAWLFNHTSQEEKKNDVMNRINVSLDKILMNKEDVLIVGHGGIMMFMRKELINRGFTGEKFKRPKNGKIYLFESQ